MQSHSVVGNAGLVLSYVIVPTTDKAWIDPAIHEVVERHGATINNDHEVIERGSLPQQIFVDCNCCNGKLHRRNEKNSIYYGMVSRLDAMHGIMQIGRKLPGQHARKTIFLKQLSQAIYTDCHEDRVWLEEARTRARNLGRLLRELTSTELKADRTKYVRRSIGPPELICSKLARVVNDHIAMD